MKMSDSKTPKLNITRIVIETTSPMAIHSGGRELGFDNQLARDANNLPYIPATTIAGVWRHMLQRTKGEQIANAWFGSNDENKQHASILQIDNGEVHNHKNEPQNGLVLDEIIKNDQLLSLLVQENPHKRERVRINDRGTAAHEAKFDQILLPTGIRFSIDIRWNNDQSIVGADFIKDWGDILNLWTSPDFAFGSSTRNGLGRFKIIQCYDELLNLGSDETMEKITGFNNRSKNPKQKILFKIHNINKVMDMTLQADSTWRCGSSEHLLDKEQSLKDPKILTYSEKVIDWNKNIASLDNKAKPVLCGSSIKGMLAHRITYHINRINGTWATDEIGDSQDDWESRPDEVDDLFGKKSDGENESGQVGRLMVPDCSIEYNSIVHRTHNTINRFTGGVMPQALFTEELLYQPKFNLKVYLSHGEISNTQQKAIDATIADLKIGRLSIGAATGRGISITRELKENAK